MKYEKIILDEDKSKQTIESLKQDNRCDFEKLQSEGFVQFEDESDIKDNVQTLFQGENFNNIISLLAEGHALQDMSQMGVSEDKISKFKIFLEANNYDENIVKALNAYSSDSKMILDYVRNRDLNSILEKIKSEFHQRMLEAKIQEKDILPLQKYIMQLDYDTPLYQNYENVKDVLGDEGYSKLQIRVTNALAQRMDTYFHIKDIANNLSKGLEKKSDNSITLYRAVKSSFLKEKCNLNCDNSQALIGKTISDSGFSSTSLLYDTSFAKYDDYDIVYEIFAPKGTQMAYISPFSDYGDVECEVLCNANDMLIMDANTNFVDKFGNHKILLKTLLLSKENQLQNSKDNAVEEDIM